MAPPPTDPHWVSQLAGVTTTIAEKALDEAQAETALEHHILVAHKESGRDFYAQIQAPLELYALVRILRPRHVVEVGVSSGVSSAYFLQALSRNGRGRLHSIDFPTQQKGSHFSEKDDSPVAVPPGKGSGWAVPAELKQGWDLRIGKSEDLLPDIVRELDQVDIFLHDDLHTFEHATWEFRTVDPKVPVGGLVLADNSDRIGGALEKWATQNKFPTPLVRTGTWLAGLTKT